MRHLAAPAAPARVLTAMTAMRYARGPARASFSRPRAMRAVSVCLVVAIGIVDAIPDHGKSARCNVVVDPDKCASEGGVCKCQGTAYYGRSSPPTPAPTPAPRNSKQPTNLPPKLRLVFLRTRMLCSLMQSFSSLTQPLLSFLKVLGFKILLHKLQVPQRAELRYIVEHHRGMSVALSTDDPGIDSLLHSWKR